MKPIKFTNFATQDFVHTYNSEPYEIKAGESIYLPGEVAVLFAKHLVNREMTRMNLPITDAKRHELVKRISPELLWHDKKHFVVFKGQVFFEEPRESLKEKVDSLNRDEKEVKEDNPKESPKEEEFEGLAPNASEHAKS